MEQGPLPQDPMGIEAAFHGAHGFDFGWQVLYFEQMRLPFPEPVFGADGPTERYGVARQFRGNGLGRGEVFRIVRKRIYMEMRIADVSEDDKVFAHGPL